jgi:hypothetical protein
MRGLDWLSRWAGDYLDFSRTAERVMELPTRGWVYTQRQINVRTMMWTLSIASAALAAGSCRGQDNCSPVLRAGLGFVGMLILAHVPIIAPLVARRCANRRRVNVAEQLIRAQLDAAGSEVGVGYQSTVQAGIAEIKRYRSVDGGRSRSSKTWRERAEMMEALQRKVKTDVSAQATSAAGILPVGTGVVPRIKGDEPAVTLRLR